MKSSEAAGDKVPGGNRQLDGDYHEHVRECACWKCVATRSQVGDKVAVPMTENLDAETERLIDELLNLTFAAGQEEHTPSHLREPSGIDAALKRLRVHLRESGLTGRYNPETHCAVEKRENEAMRRIVREACEIGLGPHSEICQGRCGMCRAIAAFSPSPETPEQFPAGKHLFVED